MAEYSGFFNAKELDTGGYDREYDAEQFADYFSRFISNGVFGNPANNLQVVYLDNSEKPFNVTIKKGSAFIEGYWYELTEDMEVEIPANTQATQAMHTICCTLDKQERKVYIRLRENVVSDLPERTENVFDLVLSRITVQSNASKLNASDIVDRRANNDYCGFVVGLVSQIDTTDLFNQYDSAFNEWFQKVKDQLTEDAAGNLQNQIDGIKTDVETNKTGIKTLDNSFIETTSEVLSNTEQKKIASALAVKGLVDYTPMIPLRGYSGDMNNMPTGTFLCELAKCTNAPSYPMGMWAHVICYAGFSQTAIFYNGNNYPPVIATRTYANNAWTAWAEQAQGFDFASVRINGLISNALQVDLTNPYADVNKPRYVDRAKSATNMPTDCQWGIREVCQITSNWVMVRITGWTIGAQQAIWTNVYVNSKWVGWTKHSYGVDKLTQSGLSINSGRCKILSGGYYVQNKIAHVQMKIQALTALSSRQFWVMIRGFPQPVTESALAITKYNALGKSVGCYVQKSLNVASGEIVITTAGDDIDANEYYVISGDYVVA